MRKSSVKNLKKILPIHDNDPAQQACVKTGDDVVNDGARAVFDVNVKVVGGPHLHNIKEAEGHKDHGEMPKVIRSNKEPGHEHANHLVNHDP